MATCSQRLAEWVSSLRYEDIPSQVVEKARLAFLDVLGIALASSGMDFGKDAIALAGDLGTGEEASVVGSDRRLPAPNAALANGTLAHGLDFDDTHAESIIHTSACVVPSALAATEACGAGGRDLLTAAVAGWEALIRIGLVCPGQFHDRGFHATAVCGPFAASLVAGKLWESSPEEMVHALGICGSMAAGSLEFLTDGSWTKRVHPGWAGHSGLVAARMARRRFTGPKEVFEGRFGFYNLYVGTNGKGRDLTRLTGGLGERWRTLELDYKPFPCCHFTHAFIDAALFLRGEHRLRPAEIESVECRIHPREMPVVCDPVETKRRPQTTYDAQFSVPFTVAAGLTQEKVDLDTFLPATLHDEDILDLAARTTCVPDETQNFPRYFPGTVTVRLKDGRALTRHEPYNRGCAENPVTIEDVQRKFRANAARVLPGDRVEAVLSAVGWLEAVPEVSELMSVCRPA
ncbi:MAG: MmgE/PrpD family protein [Candidatus Tectomicrobia bacterium]|nr:MmgE/PrpD family protein [Candidatus Tectomicrobia bacterium]